MEMSFSSAPPSSPHWATASATTGADPVLPQCEHEPEMTDSGSKEDIKCRACWEAREVYVGRLLEVFVTGWRHESVVATRKEGVEKRAGKSSVSSPTETSRRKRKREKVGEGTRGMEMDIDVKEVDEPPQAMESSLDTIMVKANDDIEMKPSPTTKQQPPAPPPPPPPEIDTDIEMKPPPDIQKSIKQLSLKPPPETPFATMKLLPAKKLKPSAKDGKQTSIFNFFNKPPTKTPTLEPKPKPDSNPPSTPAPPAQKRKSKEPPIRRPALRERGSNTKAISYAESSDESDYE